MHTLRTLSLITFTLGLAAACATGADEAGADASELSAVHQAQIATRVYRKLVGRDPTAAEIRALREATLDEMVDHVLASEDYARNGFFSFQRDRLLLHRDGDDNWRRRSLGDYCALKLDLEDVARADQDGAGYYEILRYRDRWLSITDASLGIPVACLAEKVGPLKKAMNLPGGAATATPTAQTCASRLNSRAAFKTALGALPTSANEQPMLTTAPARTLLADLLKERAFKPASGAGPAVELADDASGRPALRVPNGVANDRCDTLDALAPSGAASPTTPATPTIPVGTAALAFLKVRVPEVTEGVHGSMYWLSRHGSTQKNRDLHRARMVFFSYLCTEISPAMAAVGGGEPVHIPELVPYFDPADEHVNSSANCYNCHTQVQPIANYFGELTKGTDYTATATPTFFSNYHRGDGFRRPGGLWKGDAFHPDGAGAFGMGGLADLLSNLPAAHECIARNAWGSLVGSGYPLTDRERSAAVAAFKGDGTFRFSSLLRHLAVESPRGKAFFEGGENALAQVQPPASPDCRDVASVPDDAADAHKTLLVGSCAGCHSGSGSRAFFDRVIEGGVSTSVFNPERQVGPDLRYKHLAEFYDNAYCKVWSDQMPIGGWSSPDATPADAMKKKALCFLGGKRNEAARASDDPQIRALDARPCAGQDGPPNRDPHPIQPD
ncbi:MAG: DUF1588 domain-containing protein [Labilithrix sp.]|nr:DUF1588 domain-containing protein [Labilithrix sp.]MCW5811134.1 DUF1588 domain-containing protein [Labilithrix sp.]